MIYDVTKKFQFHIELTDKCNARCPQCSRNVINKETEQLQERSNLAFSEITIDNFKSIFDDFQYQIKRLNFCGNFGDPIFAKDVLEITDYIGSNLLSKHPIGHLHLHTNGGMRTPHWWKEYGKLLSTYFPNSHMVTFSIDGLEDTHHLYRVNTRYDRVLENALAFIEGGGIAEWSFIIFAHNEHQVEEARKKAVQYKFKSFIPVYTQRFYGNNYLNYVYNNKKVKIEVAKNEKTNQRQEKANNWIKYNKSIINDNKGKISCKAKNRQEVYLDCLGDVYPCCWIGSWNYRRNYLVNTTEKDVHPIFEMRENRNAIEESLSQIVEDDFFKYTLPASFDINPCNICVKQCSDADVKTIKNRERL